MKNHSYWRGLASLPVICWLLVSPALFADNTNGQEGDISSTYAERFESIQQLSAQKLRSLKASLKLDTSTLAGKDIRAITPSNEAIKLSAQNLDANIRGNTLLVEKLGSKPTMSTIGDSKVWQLPMKFTYIRSDGSHFNFNMDVKELKPLQFDYDKGKFTGVLGLSIVDESNPQSAETLAMPIHMALAGPLASIEPLQPEITHLSQPYTEVRLESTSLEQEIPVDVIVSALNESNQIMVSTIRPGLEVEVSPEKGVDGFGLATADVTVRAESGSAARGLSVVLSRSAGTLRENRLELDASGTASTQLRSAFVGNAEVTAKGYPFVDASGSVTFNLPLIFAIVAVVGAILGATVAQKRQDRGIVNSLVFGVIGGVLGSLGVNFLSLPVEIPAGEGFIFVVTFLTAYLGPSSFKKLLPQTA